jgi:hypothetical protein
MKKLLIASLLMVSNLGMAVTQYGYVQSPNKNNFSLLLGHGPSAVSYEQVKDCVSVVRQETNFLYGFQYSRMFTKNVGGNIGFLSNGTVLGGLTLGW